MNIGQGWIFLKKINNRSRFRSGRLCHLITVGFSKIRSVWTSMNVREGQRSKMGNISYLMYHVPTLTKLRATRDSMERSILNVEKEREETNKRIQLFKCSRGTSEINFLSSNRHQEEKKN